MSRSFDHLPSLKRLLTELQKIPYLASKNLYRVATHIVTSQPEKIDQLCQALEQAKQYVKNCRECFNWVEGQQVCSICSDDSRETKVICVVEMWQDMFSIERTRQFRGRYHILGGVLCPLEGIGPDQLSINQLIMRCKSGTIQEIIFATNPTPEGEATASFIYSKIQDQDLIVSRLANGLPMGSSLEFMDRVTIHEALVGRRPF